MKRSHDGSFKSRRMNAPSSRDSRRRVRRSVSRTFMRRLRACCGAALRGTFPSLANQRDQADHVEGGANGEKRPLPRTADGDEDDSQDDEYDSRSRRSLHAASLTSLRLADTLLPLPFKVMGP